MPIINVQIPLIQRLAKAYQKQVPHLASGPIFIRVDDRDSDDTYMGFCDIHLTMRDRDADQFNLRLDNVPFDDHVKEIATGMDATWQTTRTGERLTINLPAKSSEKIRELANAVRNVVGRGKRYPDPNWKWISRRTAKSLEQLAVALSTK